MEELKNFIKKHHISYDFLSEETGYSKIYFSQVLNGHKIPSEKFTRLLKSALTKYHELTINTLKKEFPYESS